MIALPFIQNTNAEPGTRLALSDAQTDQILAQLADPSQSFLAVARAHNTSPESLALWLARPEIAARFASIRTAVAARTRWIAAEYLPACAELASRIVRSSLESPNLNTPDSALRAARLLLRLATFDPDARPRIVSSRSRTEHPIPNPPAAARPHVATSQHILDAAAELMQSTQVPFTRSVPELDPEIPTKATDTIDSNSSSLNLPPGLLASILPSFKESERNPFHPEPGLLNTAPNQRAIVKLRLKQHRKQVIDEAWKFLLQHQYCTEFDLSAVRQEIEHFYRGADAELSARNSAEPRPPPSTEQLRPNLCSA